MSEFALNLYPVGRSESHSESGEPAAAKLDEHDTMAGVARAAIRVEDERLEGAREACRRAEVQGVAADSGCGSRIRVMFRLRQSLAQRWSALWMPAGSPCPRRPPTTLSGTAIPTPTLLSAVTLAASPI